MEKEKKNLQVALTISIALSMASFPIFFIVGSILITVSTDSPAHAGIAPALLLLSGALSSYWAGTKKAAIGYKKLILLAASSGFVGASIALGGALLSQLWLTVIGTLLVGAGHGAIFFGRYAIAEVNDAKHRGMAMSKVVMGATVGAIAGPFLITLSNMIGGGLGFPENTFPFAAVVLFYFIILVIVALLVDEKVFSNTGTAAGGDVPSVREYLRNNRIRFAVVSMFISQLLMVLIMAITPAYMHVKEFDMPYISLVLSCHFIGMYGLSFISGWISDKYGRVVPIVAGFVVFWITAAVGYLEPTLITLMVGLLLLGLGWNMSFISGSALIATEVKGKMGKLQGFNESLLNVAAFSASVSSGYLLKLIDFDGLMFVLLASASLPIIYLLAGVSQIKAADVTNG